MQPYSQEFAAKFLAPQKRAISIGRHAFIAQTGDGQGWIVDRSNAGEVRHPIQQVMGGKNVYYFLTPLERGRLQVLPLAYDVHRKEWLDTAKSGQRHQAEGPADSVDWRDPLYTFNSACFGCHVSQYSSNYDAKTDAYHSVWTEPGINCETCHGPAQAHNELFAALNGQAPPGGDIKIVSTKKFSVDQINALCMPCHAKLLPLTSSFQPGERFFDRYDVVTLESMDFYADGKDLGENFTVPGWLMSPCAKSGQLSCLYCHTSSGRYRFAGQDSDKACSGCHLEQASNVEAHSHHPADSKSPHCVDCHMMKTEFARMQRSDHSMLPPMPAAAVRFGSPNACTICHKNKTPTWADKHVRAWHGDGYQEQFLYRAELVAAARKQDWRRLPEMLAYIVQPQRDQVFAVSLIRLLSSCADASKFPVLYQAAKDHSPLVRAAAVVELGNQLRPESIPVLAAALSDDFRLVRVRAAAALAGVAPDSFASAQQAALTGATLELLAAWQSRADDFSSQFNLGNFYLARHEAVEAIARYEIARKLRPDFLPTYVNMSQAYSMAGKPRQAEERLRQALLLEPGNAAVHLNIGLLLAEEGRREEAKQAFLHAWKFDPTLAQAAYNLGMLQVGSNPNEGLQWLERAYRLRSSETRYGYAWAFYLHTFGSDKEAAAVLADLVRADPSAREATALLNQINATLASSKK